MTYAIDGFEFDFGDKRYAVPTGSLTVLVGPNNAGKSRTLQDLLAHVVSGTRDTLTILKSVMDRLPDREHLPRYVRMTQSTGQGHQRIEGVGFNLQMAVNENLDPSYFGLYPNCEQPHVRGHFYSVFGKTFVAHLAAEGRFQLTAMTGAYDADQAYPSNALQAFFSSSIETQTELRLAFKSAFDMDIALDWSTLMNFKLKVAKDFGDIPRDIDGLKALMRPAQELTVQGDGYRSFAGVALAMLTFPDRLLLLDEPEAFLHPAQARALGRWVAIQSKKRAGQVVIASHSADFLSGLLSAPDDVSILRLNRTEQGTYYHQVPSSVLTDLVKSPALFSQPVLGSLFHKGVVICEGDPDRSVYQAVASRCVADGEDFLFIHSNGKGGMKGPAATLRKSATPVCLIVDVDIFNSDEDLCALVNACSGMDLSDSLREKRSRISDLIGGLPDSEARQALVDAVLVWTLNIPSDVRQARRALVSAARAGSNKWDKIKKGIDNCSDEIQTIAWELINGLKAYGLFVVPVGELEGWIKLGRAKGGSWNRAALATIQAGTAPQSLVDFVTESLSFLRAGGLTSAGDMNESTPLADDKSDADRTHRI